MTTQTRRVPPATTAAARPGAGKRGRPTRVLRATGAFLALALIVVGVPALLLALKTVPGSLPSLHQVQHTLTTRDDGSLLADILAAGVWVAWAMFVVGLVPELLALLTRRPALRLPGLGPFQRSAAALLAVIALAFTVLPAALGSTPAFATTTLSTSVTQTVAKPAPTPPASTPLPQATSNTPLPPATAAVPASPPSTSPTYEVQRRDTLWAIAESHLGAGLRYREIVALNRDRIGADNTITPGTVLTLPAHATRLDAVAAAPAARPEAHPSADNGETAVTVTAGETLAGIDSTVTGEPNGWSAAWERNRDRAEPAGAHFTNPDLIRPGWTLDIPHAAGHDAAPATASSQTSSDPAFTNALNPAPPVAPATPPVAPPAAAPRASSPPSSTSAPRGTEPAAPETVPGSATDWPPQTASHRPTGPVARTSEEVPISGLLGAFAGGAGLLLAGVALGAVARHRRRQAHERRPGRSIHLTPPPLRHVERSLLVASRVGAASGAIDARWFEQSLLGLAQALRRSGAAYPDVIAARLSSSELELVLTGAAPAPPAPWTSDATATRWTLGYDEPALYADEERESQDPPYPQLVSVGYTDSGDQWMLDLERIGTVSLSGDVARCLALSRFIAAELANNSWSKEDLGVTLCGFGEELTAINSYRLRYTPDGIAAVADHLLQLQQQQAQYAASSVGVLADRHSIINADAYSPRILFFNASTREDEGDRLTTLLDNINDATPRLASAVVVTGDKPHPAARYQLTVDSTGLLTVPSLDLQLRAQQINAEESVDFAAFIASTLTWADDPVPAVAADPVAASLNSYADAHGGLLPELADKGPARPSTPPLLLHVAGKPEPAAAAAIDSLLPLATSVYVTTTATVAADLDAIAPTITEEVTREVERLDPTLDDDLNAWYDVASVRPKLTMLGPVRVKAQGQLPPDRPREPYYTEVVAYLATRSGPVSIERFVADFWPERAKVSSSTPRDVISRVRAWLGTDPETGDGFIPTIHNKTPGDRARGYQLDGALVDAELFRRLRARAVARGQAGIPDLQKALDLVQGVPFSDTRSERYAWLADTPVDHHYVAMIVDVAHSLATHYLAAGQPSEAEQAALVATQAGSTEDIALLDLVAACDAQNSRSQAEAYIADIMRYNDAEVEEDLPIRTAEILHRRARSIAQASRAQ